MATHDQKTTKVEFVLSTDSNGAFTFTPIETALSSAENVQQSAIFSTIVAAMPSELKFPFLDSRNSNDGYDFAMELVHEFNGGVYPSWLAQLPETAQTYFVSRWMGAVLDQTDLFGSSSVVVTALVLTKGSGGVTSTVAGSATFVRSQAWHYMSVLTEHLPAAVQILKSGSDADFATAVYNQFTSGTAPPWFQAMPTDVQSFVVLDYLPNWLSVPMTIDLLASSAARLTATTEPTGTTGPAANNKSTPSVMNQTSSKRGTIVAAILIPLFILALALGFAIFFVRYRRRRRAKSLASSLPPLDPEQAVRRWSETTFSTAVSPQEQRHQSSLLPPVTLTESPERNSHALRRAMSESDLGQVANPELKMKDLEGVETQSDRAELEARTAPLVRC